VIMKKINKLAELRDRAWNKVCTNVHHQIYFHVWSLIHDSAYDQVSSQVWNQVKNYENNK